MRKFRVDSVNKILITPAQSPFYVLYYKYNTLISTHDLLVCIGNLVYYLAVQPIDDVAHKLSD